MISLCFQILLKLLYCDVYLLIVWKMIMKWFSYLFELLLKDDDEVSLTFKCFSHDNGAGLNYC